MASQPSPLTDDPEPPSLRDRIRNTVQGAAERVLPEAEPTSTDLPQGDDDELPGEIADVLYRIGSEVRRVVKEESGKPSGDWRIFAFGLVLGIVATVTVAALVVWAIISLRGAL